MHKTLSHSLLTAFFATSLTPILPIDSAHAEGMAGISLGQAIYEDDVITQYKGEDANNGAISYKIYAGLPLGSHLSAHAGLFSLGKISSSTPDPSGGNSVSTSLETKGFFLEGRWQWRSGQAWRPYAKLGVAIVNSETIAIIRNPPLYDPTVQQETNSSASLVPGFGMVYETLQHWGLQLEIERYFGIKAQTDTSGHSIDNASLGVYGYW
jgi:hypothetical protein